MSKRNRVESVLRQLEGVGISRDDAKSLRRISMTLRRWFELECGTDLGAIERDETTGKTYWRNAYNTHRWPTPDRETGAMRRLAAIMARYPTLASYIQGDCRGAALYILRPCDLPEGCSAASYYSRGLCVY